MTYEKVGVYEDNNDHGMSYMVHKWYMVHGTYVCTYVVRGTVHGTYICGTRYMVRMYIRTYVECGTWYVDTILFVENCPVSRWSTVGQFVSNTTSSSLRNRYYGVKI